MNYEIVIVDDVAAALQQLIDAARATAGQPEYIIDWEVEGATTTQRDSGAEGDPQVEVIGSTEPPRLSFECNPAVVEHRAQQLDAHQHWRRSPEYLALDSAYKSALQLIGTDNYYLPHELGAAHDRLIDEPFGGLRYSRFRYDPGAFADFIEELLDPEARTERIRLVQRSWSAGNNPYGYTNKQIRQGTAECIEADMRTFDEMEDPDDLLLEQGRYLPEY